jgi:superfamily II DNA helicase RecQ
VDGGNCLVLMPTGGGKSLCYQLPSLLRAGCGIVVSPLIALMRDQVAGLLEAGVKAAVLNSTLSFNEASAVEARLIAGDLDLLYIAPERLLTPRFARSRENRLVCDRRGALRVAMGARFSSRIYRPVRYRRALSRRAAHRADGHGR